MTPERMIELFNDGKTFLEIGRMCNPSVSRAAVAGKIWRYRKRNGLLNERDPILVIPETKPLNDGAVSLIKMPENAKTFGNFLDVVTKNTCRFIQGDPRHNPVFCGPPRHGNKSFCAYHTNVCYRKITVGNNF